MVGLLSLIRFTNAFLAWFFLLLWFTQLALPNAGGCVKPQGYYQKNTNIRTRRPEGST
jgi:hypothetical protein